MRIVILGGGVIGTASAYYLAQAGHEVVVLERQPGVALETSFANAGEISPGYASPWAAPGVPKKAIKWLTMRYGPLAWRPALDPSMLRWIMRMLLNCTHEAYARNKARMVRLAEYSRDCLDKLRSDTAITYDERQQGTLQLFRTQKQFDGIGDDLAVLKQYGVKFELLDQSGCIAVEPGLSQVREKFFGGLRLPGDETGDCFKFSRRLAELACQAQVDFRFGVSILGLEVDGDGVTGVRTADGLVQGDVYVVALGSYSPLLLKPLGLDLPIYPIKGYSITAQIKNADHAPVSTIMDETYKVAITRLGDRVRVGGTAEIAGYNYRLHEGRKQTLLHSLTDLFPEVADLGEINFWCGLRPMTPDGTPLLGRAGYKNLYLNTGHGTLGWTMACGSACVLTDLIEGCKPAIDLEGLDLSRYH